MKKIFFIVFVGLVIFIAFIINECMLSTYVCYDTMHGIWHNVRYGI